MANIDLSGRREFLTGGSIAAGLIFLTGRRRLKQRTSLHKRTKATTEAGKPAEEVSPPEDLMREHGVLKRILLIYGEAFTAWMRGRICRRSRWRSRPS